ncbi:peptidoglycan bridge formation protein FemAB [Candidatus Cerribacteria bacterium 'Amazon FNV 2010 28 9']|uniref:Peptidoglycan bridge formation protein FemAB n=1 Tax=Candidatus Cerribacteria bacterium 'Amazon FNV 2010 28 9' TaxID=2081795 RepID=A0A317JLR1_9BACT|nr:MAG: peptidoglycan bridge formation protein FemAB [Candidatus Cerribacteria bacterium 'Amazon FNV 2010 28 9']
MIIRPIGPNEKDAYDSVVAHPLQSFSWGEFRKKTGVAVERIGIFDGQRMVGGFSITFHPVPHTSYTIGYFPKGPMPDEAMLGALKQIGARHNAICIKLEPNVSQAVDTPSAHSQVAQFLLAHHCRPGKPLFTKYTFVLSLTPSEDELLAAMRGKTRYNINLAEKKGVHIIEDTSVDGMMEYLKVLKETTSRQGFYAHDEEYFKQMWKTIGSSGMLHIFKAIYEDNVLTVWIVFVFNGKLYYPYGASTREHKEVMANNLMMWEVIKYGKKQGCTSFDMWGSLGPNPDPKDPWFGFHKFKEGYGGVLTQFIGTYDFILNPAMYSIYTTVDKLRWKVLRLKSKLKR